MEGEWFPARGLDSLVEMAEGGHVREERASRAFSPEPREVYSARHFVASVLEKWGFECDDLPLLVSELATNAVLHARSDFEVTVVRSGPRLRVEVYDQNTRLPSFAVAPPDAYSGRGLMLLRELATAWGVESHSDSGKTIWFELELPADRIHEGSSC
ncbi:MAG TPA: ATP-binding protein [Acidimicrobiales bacterium]|nr:ATP-binding protein [Acidimicrobiales bacterium]